MWTFWEKGLLWPSFRASAAKKGLFGQLLSFHFPAPAFPPALRNVALKPLISRGTSSYAQLFYKSDNKRLECNLCSSGKVHTSGQQDICNVLLWRKKQGGCCGNCNFEFPHFHSDKSGRQVTETLSFPAAVWWWQLTFFWFPWWDSTHQFGNHWFEVLDLCWLCTPVQITDFCCSYQVVKMCAGKSLSGGQNSRFMLLVLQIPTFSLLWMVFTHLAFWPLWVALGGLHRSWKWPFWVNASADFRQNHISQISGRQCGKYLKPP